MKSLIFVISALAIFAGAASDCFFDPIGRCAERWIQGHTHALVGDDCDEAAFHICTYSHGRFHSERRACERCYRFSQDASACSVRTSDPDCQIESPVTENIRHQYGECTRAGPGYQQVFRPGSGLITYIWVDTGYELPCPPGTYFNLGQCQCTFCYPGGPCAGSNDLTFTLNFKNKDASVVYYELSPTCQISSNSPTGTAALLLDGESAHARVPYFQNNVFSEFTITLHFQRLSAGGNGQQGIVYNGDSPQSGNWPASISIISTSLNSLTAGIVTDDGSFQIAYSAAVAPDVYHYLELTFTGTTLKLSVDGHVQTTAASGVTLANMGYLLLGESYDSTGTPHFFDGYLDGVTFYRKAQ